MSSPMDHRPRAITLVLPDLAPREAEALISCFEQLLHELWDAYHEAIWSPEPDAGDAIVNAAPSADSDDPRF